MNKISACLVVGLCVVIGGQSVVREAFAATVQAGKSDAVVEAAGVATHLSWGTSLYSTQFPQTKAAMQELGVRYYRSDAGNFASLRPKIQDLYNSFGARGVFIISEYVGDYNTQLKAGTAAGIMDQLVANGSQGIYALEGPNEYDHSNRATWPAELRAYQAEIYNHAKSNPARFGSILISGPSLVTGPGDPGSSQALGNISNLVDIGTHHQYECCGRQIDLRTLEAHRLISNTNYGGKPLLYTETGVCTNRAAGGNSASMCVSERAQAKYILRSLLDKFKADNRNKVFIYEFLDQNSTQGNAAWNWGIVRSNFTRKPAYSAYKNLLKILEDKGNTNFTPGSLTYDLTGTNANVRSLLVQKKDGRFYLMVWQATSAFNTNTGQDVEAAPLNLTLRLNSPTNIARYEPTPLGQYQNPDDGATPRQRYENVSTVSFNVADHVVVLEIGANAGTPSQNQGTCRNLYTPGSTPAAGYGAAWNTQGTGREYLVEAVSCTAGDATFRVGAVGKSMYVYRLGYRWTGSSWAQVSYGNPTQGEWIVGTGSATVPRAGANTYVVGYTCQLVNGSWKCGCRDAACGSPSWQLQAVY